LDLPTTSREPIASTSIQNNISVLDLPTTSPRGLATSTNTQNNMSDHECSTTIDHRQKSTNEILQYDVVDVGVFKIAICNPIDEGEKNTRFLSRRFKGNNNIKLIVEEAHDQAASNIYPHVYPCSLSLCSNKEYMIYHTSLKHVA